MFCLRFNLKESEEKGKIGKLDKLNLLKNDPVTKKKGVYKKIFNNFKLFFKGKKKKDLLKKLNVFLFNLFFLKYKTLLKILFL